MKIILMLTILMSFITTSHATSDTQNSYDLSKMLYSKIKLPQTAPQTARNALAMALNKAQDHDRDRLANSNWIMVVDFSQHSKNKRGYLCNLKNGEVVTMRVAHGSNSGGAIATKFSNSHESHQSSLGLYLAKNAYQGKHKLSLKLEGLQSLNDRAKDRDIVVHSAKYTTDAWVKKYGRLGRSHGCLALDPAIIHTVINNLKGGSFIYIYSEAHKKLLETTY